MNASSEGYVLHDYARSSASFRIRIALNLKGVRYARALHDLQSGEHKTAEFLSLNAQGLVPAIETPDGAVLTQSLAIIEYLDAVHPEPLLVPAEPAAAAQVRAMAQRIACDIHPINNLRVLRYLRDELSLDQEDVDRWVRRWIGEGFSSIEADLAARPRQGRFLCGDAVSLADVCLAPQVFNARRFGMALDAFPRLEACFRACMAIEGFARAAPDGPAR